MPRLGQPILTERNDHIEFLLTYLPKSRAPSRWICNKRARGGTGTDCVDLEYLYAYGVQYVNLDLIDHKPHCTSHLRSGSDLSAVVDLLDLNSR